VHVCSEQSTFFCFHSLTAVCFPFQRPFHDCRDRRKFGVKLVRRPGSGSPTGNRSAIPTTGHSPASAQIRAYLDRTTRFSRTGYLPGIAAPAVYRKTPVQSGTNLTLYICTISGRVDLTYILYSVYFLYIFTTCTRVGLTYFVRITHPLVVVRRYPQTSVYMFLQS